MLVKIWHLKVIIGYRIFEDVAVVMFQGRTHITAEDARWILILEKKPDGVRHYLCVRCGDTFHGKPGRVISHCLRISGEQVCICKRTLPDDCKDVLIRLRNVSKQRATPLSQAVKSTAIGKTPSVLGCLTSSEQKLLNY